MQTALGHADIRTTLKIYAKAVPGWEQDAAAKLDAYLDARVREGCEKVDTPNPAVRQRFPSGPIPRLEPNVAV